MSIPHRDRVPYTKIPIATPGELAAALRARGYPVREQPGRRWPIHTTTALCHGGDSPDKLGLCFDAERGRWADNCLTGGCDSRAIVHSVQAATELWLCRCDACWSAWGAREALAKPQTATDGHRGASDTPAQVTNAVQAHRAAQAAIQRRTRRGCGRPLMRRGSGRRGRRHRGGRTRVTACGSISWQPATIRRRHL